MTPETTPEINETPKKMVNRPVGYQKEVTAAGLDRTLLEHSLVMRIGDFLKRNQNLIAFILLGLCLVLGLLWWQNKRTAVAQEQAAYEVENSNDIESLKRALTSYGTSALAPLIHYKLANKYMDDNKNDEAQKEYENVIQHYPKHQVKVWSEQRLTQLKANLDWQKKSVNMAQDLIKQRNLPYLIFKTPKGDFEVELYEDEAPNTVANFITLVNQKFYVGKGVVEANFRIGSIIGNNTTDSPDPYEIPMEKNYIQHVKGVLAMYRDLRPDTRSESPEKQVLLHPSGTRFYIYHTGFPIDENATGGLNGRYPVFGKVVKGLDIATNLASDDKITAIEITYKRDHEYKAQTLPVEVFATKETEDLFPAIPPTLDLKEEPKK
jgi:cyclophilin family peptidyl-prolyl cis-trans isomerase